ncbi:MAG: TonB-dependent receptor [Prolixibacteraceae bacterium]
MEKNGNEPVVGLPVHKKVMLSMRFTLFFMLLSLLSSHAATYAQTARLDLNFKDRQIRDILNQIEDQSEFTFMYDNSKIDVGQRISVDLKSATITETLDKIFQNAGVSYKIMGRHIMLYGDSDSGNMNQQQNIPISGRVVDSSGMPLPGVTVVIKGTAVGTITDTEGAYSLSNVPNNGILEFSFVGMRTLVVNADRRSIINIALEEETIGIEEVVAVGYGSIRKSDLTGSVSRVKVEDLTDRPATSVEQLLQGQVSGVQITSNTGAPGSGMTFAIRGSTSISGSNQPLIVIDGYPIDSDNGGVKMSSGSQSGYLGQLPEDNALASLNPGDIETVEILKDASATAIYGSRASNGVVLITTKRGKAGADRVSYNFRTDVSSLPQKIDVLNTSDYLKYSNEAYLNSGQDSIYKSDAIARYSETNTNWQDLIYRTAISQSHQLNISGGQEKMKYSVSAGYLGQEGIVKNSNYDRGSLRLNLDREINDKLKIGVSMNGVISRNKAAMQSSNISDVSMSVVRGALTSRPYDSPYTAEDEIDQSQAGNPLTLINLADDQNRMTSLLANMFAEYTLAKGLVFKVNTGINTTSSHRDFYHPRGTTLGNLEGGYAYRGHSSSFNYLTEYTLNFNHVFSKKHRINSVIGYTWQEWERRSFGINFLNFPNDNLGYYDLSSATSITNPLSVTEKWGLSSLIGRFNYSFDSRWLITLTARADGSTRLAEGNKWDFFPSVALGWNMHNENFMKNIDFINECKLRASYGFSGNQTIAVGATKSRLGSTGTVLNESIQIGYIQENIGNSNLHWETTRQTNLGFDMAFLKSRVTFGFEYYNKRTEDLLISLTIPPSNGFGSYNTNQGSVENKGYEFDLKGKLLTGKLKWTMGGNISFNRNKIIDLGGVDSFMGSAFPVVGGQSLHIAKVGHPIGAFYGYRIEGIYQNQDEVNAGPTDASATNAPGSFKYKDISGPNGAPDGQITADDREIIGNPYPDYVFGISNDWEWKNFMLSVLVQGSIGQDVINANRYYLDALARGVSSNVRQEAWDNRWTGEGTSNIYPRATTLASPFSNRFVDFIVEDASYIRVKNITFSYNIPLPKSIYIKNVKLFASAGNLITWSDYKGYDPEINSKGDKSMMPGVDNGSIPQYRSFSVGINVGL